MNTPETESRNVRVTGPLALLAVILLAVASARSGALALRDTWRTFKAGTSDFAVAYRDRIQPARPLLPARGTIGYISDSNDEGEFYLTQYLLVPLILEKGQRPDLILINNHVNNHAASSPGTGANDYAILESADGSKVYDFGNGIKLIDRRRQQ